ncbi:hypothetical protein, partial [Escherichia coli]|uniref:hypothetical protein n=1 Tax=Escherichia coli TaxID=562 RepID=UPI0005CFD615
GTASQEVCCVRGSAEVMLIDFLLQPTGDWGKSCDPNANIAIRLPFKNLHTKILNFFSQKNKPRRSEFR